MAISAKEVVLFENQLLRVSALNAETGLWEYEIKSSGKQIKMAAPVFEIDGKSTVGRVAQFTQTAKLVLLKNSVSEYSFSGTLLSDATLSLVVVFRVSNQSPVVRFKYILKSTSNRKLTKTKGVDNFSYFATSLTDYKHTKEVQFSNYDSKIHSYILGEQLIESRHFENECAFMEPMLLASNDDTSILFAYEHGSQYDNPFVNFKLNKDRQVSLSALKSNYVDKQLKALITFFEYPHLLN